MRDTLFHGFREHQRAFGQEPSPRRRRRTLLADQSTVGRLAWGLVFTAVKLSSVALAMVAALLVIAFGLMLWFSPAAYFGWIWWAFLFTPLGMCIGAVAADVAGVVNRLANRAGDALLYRYSG